MCSTASRRRRSTRAKQFAREQAIFGQATQFYGWHYPPFFLGLAGLLATMPYWLSLIVWQGVTLILYLLVHSRDRFLIRLPLQEELKSDTSGSCSRSPSPPSFINLGQAHNGFLTAALIGAALAHARPPADRSPAF